MTERTEISDPPEAGATATIVNRIRDEILHRQRFLLTSHARPDGDSIGSQLAMAYALESLGKQVRLVNADAAPEHYFEFPGVDRIEIAPRTGWVADALIVMECSDLTRTGVAGLDDHFIIEKTPEHGGSAQLDRWVLALQLVLRREVRRAVGERLPDQVHVETPRSRDDGDGTPAPGGDHDRLQDVIGVQVDGAGLVEGGHRGIVVDHLVRHASRVEVFGHE